VLRSPSQADKPSSLSAIRYTGSIWIPRARFGDDVHLENLVFTNSMTSNVSGIINTIYVQNPSVATSWGACSTLYDMYRVLAFELEFFPSNRYSKTTTICNPGVGLVDIDDAVTPIPSLVSGVGNVSARMLSLEDPWTDRGEYRGSSVPSLKWYMDGAEHALWINTSAPVSSAAIKVFFNGLTVSAGYGQVIVRWLVQFRGRAP